jgi:Ca2+-binding EF-hand superfamily protein
VFTLSDEYAALKQRAQSVFVREALRHHRLRKWEAFMAFDADDNGLLGASELYGALKFLAMPGLSPEEAVDFLEAGDANRDGFLDHKARGLSGDSFR